jgi:hypothetical protein
MSEKEIEKTKDTQPVSNKTPDEYDRRLKSYEEKVRRYDRG